MAPQPFSSIGLIIVEVSRFTFRHTSLCYGRGIVCITHNIQNGHTSMPRRHSNTQSQQASSRRPTPQTVRPKGSAADSDRIVKNTMTLNVFSISLVIYLSGQVSIWFYKSDANRQGSCQQEKPDCKGFTP
jgi:hypothetical protein